MSQTLPTIVSISGVIVGIGITLSFATSFYLTPYHTLGASTTDLPYDLTIVEMVIGFATLLLSILSMIYLTTPPNPQNDLRGLKKSFSLTFMAFFVTFAIFEGVVTTIRLQNLGLLGTLERTCSDTNVFTGCPTTRFESIHTQKIEYTKPTGGDCQFWFWGEMRRRSTANACESTNSSICTWYIENYMDWSSPDSYGMRHDPFQFNTTTTLQNANPNEPTMNNMEELMKIQAASVPTVLHYTTPPNLSYCWYWGCNPICNPHRYFTNRFWLLTSITLLFLYTVNFLLCLFMYSRLKKESTRSSKKTDGNNLTRGTTVNSVELEGGLKKGRPSTAPPPIPPTGRRVRQLVSNPAMLRF